MYKLSSLSLLFNIHTNFSDSYLSDIACSINYNSFAFIYNVDIYLGIIPNSFNIY